MFKFNNKEDKFYDMLSESANTVHESAKILRSSLDCLDKKEEPYLNQGIGRGVYYPN